ncbi:MAG: helix-turn-helix domain-containing protein [Pseudomonadales bacterium]|nr:helix-turn-helix domain-containing protein [Pseudomonadales bacterium]
MRYEFTPNTASSDLWALAPAVYLLDAITRVELLGHDLTQFLRSLGLRRDNLEQPGKYVTYDQYYGIIAYCINTLKVPEVGFIQERNIGLLSSGAAGLAAATSATVGEAIQVVLRYQNLMAVPVALSLNREAPNKMGQVARLTLGKLQHEARYPEPWHRVWAIETLVSSVYAMFQTVGMSQHVQSVQLSYTVPKHLTIYEETFACPVTFNATADVVIFDAAILDTLQVAADASVCSLAKRQCEASVRKLTSGASLLDQIEGIILSTSHRLPSVGTIAERLLLSERTLQRRLGELGTSYRDVANRLRHRLAVDMLNDTKLPIKEIAYLLGYTESPNFSQAFKLMEGVSPAHFRLRQ